LWYVTEIQNKKEGAKKDKSDSGGGWFGGWGSGWFGGGKKEEKKEDSIGE